MGDGKICYVEIPAGDVQASATFYRKVLGWSIRTRGDGDMAFDDATGHVSGVWVLGRTPTREPGILVWIMVESVEATLEKIVSAGGQIVSPMKEQKKGEAIATFRDPAGNTLGVFHEHKA